MAKADEDRIYLNKQANELLSHGHTEHSPEVIAIRKKIKTIKRKTMLQERRHHLKNRRQKPEDLLKENHIDQHSPPHDPTTGFDEFGVIIFKDNATSIVIALPDFDEKLVITKTEAHSYEDLITDTVFKAAVNQVRDSRNQLADEAKREKDFLSIGLAQPAATEAYDDVPFHLNIEGIDENLSEIQPPAYCLVTINIAAVCEQAGQTIEPMEYKLSVNPYQEESLNLTIDDILNAHNACDTRALFNSELDDLIATIVEKKEKSFIDRFTA